MGIIKALKVLMGSLLLAVLFALLFYVVIVRVTIATGAVPDKGATLIATMQDGDVNVYSIDGTSCFAIVGELHGKTVGMVCP